jgi:hypothetical protein
MIFMLLLMLFFALLTPFGIVLFLSLLFKSLEEYRATPQLREKISLARLERFRNITQNNLLAIFDDHLPRALKIRSQTLPMRCEICHQQDHFDAIKNFCTRCN